MLTRSVRDCVGSIWVPLVSPIIESTQIRLAHSGGVCSVLSLIVWCDYILLRGLHQWSLAGYWLSLRWLTFSSVLSYGGYGMFSLAFCLQPGPAWFAVSQSQYVLHQVGATDISSHLHAHTAYSYTYTHTQGDTLSLCIAGLLSGSLCKCQLTVFCPSIMYSAYYLCKR